MKNSEATRILKERAAELKHKDTPVVSSSKMLLGLHFKLGEENYFIDSYLIEGVMPLKELCSLPGTPAYILGITNIRGKILAIIDIKPILGLPLQGLSNRNRVIVVKYNEIELGIVADEIIGNIKIYEENINSNIDSEILKSQDYIYGIANNEIIMLDTISLLSGKQICIDQEI